jgi:hypothetical protein
MNSLESTSMMGPNLRNQGKKHHNQLVYRNGQGVVVDLADQDSLARHQEVVDKLKARFAKKEANYKGKIDECHKTEALLRVEVASLINKKQRPAMNDAVRGQVENVCKSQLWRVSKFICYDDQINFACEIVMTNIDDFRPKIIN